jgi:hypothetical protein
LIGWTATAFGCVAAEVAADAGDAADVAFAVAGAAANTATVRGRMAQSAKMTGLE